jgi:hypothetical protein
MRRPEPREDVKNLSLITVSGALSLIITGALLYAGLSRGHEQVRVEVRTQVVQPLGELGPVSGDTRLYGTVTTRQGRAHTGYIRWDRNEGSWSDLLDANKVGDGGRVTQSGVRFGHIHRIDVLDRESALLTMKSGHQTEMNGGATDLGSGLRALLVQEAGQGVQELGWRDLESVEFQSAPQGLAASEGRIFGTLTTRRGEDFTGYLTWDVDEIYTTDVLDGDADGVDQEIPFGAIASIQREGSRGAWVTLRDGDAILLTGSNDVDSDNRGISVSDPALGQVKVEWREMEMVRFWQPDTETGFGFFDGGHPIRGTVTTESGDAVTGEIAWDNDESYSWEMLNGDAGGVEFHVEMGQIARIQKTRRGSLVELKDGRSFELTGSNDVDDGNRGITIRTDNGEMEIEWEEFREMTLEG